jgi:arabinose-5-phosphate isomerase
MGDALAVALLERRGFGPEDFAVFHPGGQLGRKLLLRVRDLIHAGSDVPLVASEARVQDAVLEMTAKRLGMTGVVDAQGGLVGILTDGDLRRHLDTLDLLNRPVHSIMTVQPKSVGANALAMEAVRRMETAKITSLFALTTDPGESELDGWGSITMDGHYVMGVIHLHDLLAAGLV